MAKRKLLEMVPVEVNPVEGIHTLPELTKKQVAVLKFPKGVTGDVILKVPRGTNWMAGVTPKGLTLKVQAITKTSDKPVHRCGAELNGRTCRARVKEEGARCARHPKPVTAAVPPTQPPVAPPVQPPVAPPVAPPVQPPVAPPVAPPVPGG